MVRSPITVTVTVTVTVKACLKLPTQILRVSQMLASRTLCGLQIRSKSQNGAKCLL